MRSITFSRGSGQEHLDGAIAIAPANTRSVEGNESRRSVWGRDNVEKQHASRVVVIGNGLVADASGEINVVQSGILRDLRVLGLLGGNERETVPTKDSDPVVGIIEQKLGMHGYLVNINGKVPGIFAIASI